MADQGKYTRVPETNDTTRAAMDYFSNLILYLDATKTTVDYLTDAVEVFVGKELNMFENQRTIPFVVFISLVKLLWFD